MTHDIRRRKVKDFVENVLIANKFCEDVGLTTDNIMDKIGAYNAERGAALSGEILIMNQELEKFRAENNKRQLRWCRQIIYFDVILTLSE